MTIDNGRMVLKFTENAKKCALFTSMDHKAYNELPNYNLDRVTKFWVNTKCTKLTIDCKPLQMSTRA
jgi:hypothetical protein